MTEPAWLPDAVRRYVGLLDHRPAGEPKPAPEWVLAECRKWKAWNTWRNTGGPRPLGVPARVPKWWWTIRVEWLAKYQPAHKPPDPPDDPPSRWANAPWRVPHVHISHGLRANDGVWTVDQLVNRCLTYGVKAIFCQLGGDCPDPDWSQHCRDLREACRPHGIPVGGWSRADYVPWEKVRDAVRSVAPLAGYLADIEGRCVDQQLPEHLVAEFADEMPLGVIATGGIDQSLDEPDVEHVAARWGPNLDMVMQDYYKTDLPLTPDSGENFTYWRSTAKVKHGFRHQPDTGGHWHVPVVMPNAETCPPMSAHIPWLKDYAPHFGVWDAELLEKGQFELGTGCWDAFRAIATRTAYS